MCILSPYLVAAGRHPMYRHLSSKVMIDNMGTKYGCIFV